MTECERLIANGFITEDFLKEEVRCDFLVTTERKKIWAIELDLLREFDRVCKKHRLRYWADGGTLLGTIRHEGFIPWDDDIDILLPRCDYEKLMLLGNEFSAPYFLQTPYSDEGYGISFIKLRNSNTSCIQYPFRYEHFNMGLSIDIFPLDTVCKKTYFDEAKRIKELILENSANMRRSNPHPSTDDIERINKYPPRNPIEVYEKIHQIARRYEGQQSEWCSQRVCTIYGPDRLLYLQKTFNNTIFKKFENTIIPAPEGYELQLKTIYGDYMQLPPIEERGKWHDTCIMNPDVPYAELQRKMGMR